MKSPRLPSDLQSYILTLIKCSKHKAPIIYPNLLYKRYRTIIIIIMCFWPVSAFTRTEQSPFLTLSACSRQWQLQYIGGLKPAEAQLQQLIPTAGNITSQAEAVPACRLPQFHSRRSCLGVIKLNYVGWDPQPHDETQQQIWHEVNWRSLGTAPENSWNKHNKEKEEKDSEQERREREHSKINHTVWLWRCILTGLFSSPLVPSSNDLQVTHEVKRCIVWQKKSVHIVCSWATPSHEKWQIKMTPIKEPNETANTAAVAPHDPVLFKRVLAVYRSQSDMLAQLWRSRGNVLFRGTVTHARNGDRQPVSKSRLHERIKIQMRRSVLHKCIRIWHLHAHSGSGDFWMRFRCWQAGHGFLS